MAEKFPEYKHEKSKKWFDRALAAVPSGVPGHLGPSEGLFLPITKWPLMCDHAKGTYFWDVDGNKYIDYMCAYGPNVLGYSDPDVDKAAFITVGFSLYFLSTSTPISTCVPSIS